MGVGLASLSPVSSWIGLQIGNVAAVYKQAPPRPCVPTLPLAQRLPLAEHLAFQPSRSPPSHLARCVQPSRSRLAHPTHAARPAGAPAYRRRVRAWQVGLPTDPFVATMRSIPYRFFP
eukprot:1988418-Prymnesium_polylepis.1